MSYSKSSKRERRLTQNPAREKEDLFKIQQGFGIVLALIIHSCEVSGGEHTDKSANEIDITHIYIYIYTVFCATSA